MTNEEPLPKKVCVFFISHLTARLHSVTDQSMVSLTNRFASVSLT